MARQQKHGLNKGILTEGAEAWQTNFPSEYFMVRTKEAKDNERCRASQGPWRVEIQDPRG